MFVLTVPNTLRPERLHAAELVFGARLGAHYRVVFEERSDVALSVDGFEGRTLIMPDLVLGAGDRNWPQSAPKPSDLPVQCRPEALDTALPAFPVLFGGALGPGKWWHLDASGGQCGIDILGTTFWVLARVEELMNKSRDLYDRFAGRAAHAVRCSYIDRPIVDEMLLAFRALLARLWPELQLSWSSCRAFPTHDVDRPYKHLFQSPRGLIRTMATDLLRARGLGNVWAAPSRWIRVKRGSDTADPYFTFDLLMDDSERQGLRCAFYFIAGRTGGALDGDYELGHPRVRLLLRRIHRRGHEIGLHGSFNTFRNAAALAAELHTLQTVCEQEGIQQASWGGRQHVLRFDSAATPAVLEAAGLAYDSTLGYADVSGFRCGTSLPFPLYDHRARRTLTVVERPLTAMDVTLIGDRYERRTVADAIERVRALRRACGAVGGEFVSLWHNCHLSSAREREIYQAAFRVNAA